MSSSAAGEDLREILLADRHPHRRRHAPHHHEGREHRPGAFAPPHRVSGLSRRRRRAFRPTVAAARSSRPAARRSRERRALAAAGGSTLERWTRSTQSPPRVARPGARATDQRLPGEARRGRAPSLPAAGGPATSGCWRTAGCTRPGSGPTGEARRGALTGAFLERRWLPRLRAQARCDSEPPRASSEARSISRSPTSTWE